jgi:hypothetical protein
MVTLPILRTIQECIFHFTAKIIPIPIHEHTSILSKPASVSHWQQFSYSSWQAMWLCVENNTATGVSVETNNDTKCTTGYFK